MLVRSNVVGALCGVVSLFAVCQAEAKPLVTYRRTPKAELVVTVGPTTETFPPWSDYLGSATNRSRTLVFFRYRLTAQQPNGSWRPSGDRRVRVVRVADGKTLGDYAPGVGGEFHWVGDRILQEWGCGSNCSVFSLREPDGTQIADGAHEGVFHVIADRYLVYPVGTFGEGPVRVIDVQALKTRLLPVPQEKDVLCSIVPRGNRVVVERDGRPSLRFTLDDPNAVWSSFNDEPAPPESPPAEGE